MAHITGPINFELQPTGDVTIDGKYLNICTPSDNPNSLNKKIIKKIELNRRVLKLDLLYMATWDVMLINTDTNMLVIRKAHAIIAKRTSIWEIRLVVNGDSINVLNYIDPDADEQSKSEFEHMFEAIMA